MEDEEFVNDYFDYENTAYENLSDEAKEMRKRFILNTIIIKKIDEEASNRSVEDICESGEAKQENSKSCEDSKNENKQKADTEKQKNMSSSFSSRFSRRISGLSTISQSERSQAGNSVSSQRSRQRSSIASLNQSLRQSRNGFVAFIAATISPDQYDEKDVCTICLCDYEEGDEIASSPNSKCKHSYHKECILEWLMKHDNCPCCRVDYLSNTNEDNNSKQGCDQCEFCDEQPIPQGYTSQEID